MRRSGLIGVIVALALTGCGLFTEEAEAVDPAEVRAWGNSYAPRFLDLAEILQGAQRAMPPRDFERIAIGCEELAVWGDEMSMALPVPDPDADEHWQRIVELVSEAAEACKELAIEQTDEAAQHAALLMLQLGKEGEALMEDVRPYLN